MQRIIFSLIIAIVFLAGCSDIGKKEAYKKQNVKFNVSLYLGAENCKECHQEAYDDWRKSDHFFSMQKATTEFVRADFTSNFNADEIAYRFYKTDSIYFVEIRDQEEIAQTFEVVYTFGWHPLQQYLLKAANGKFQTLRASWDTEKEQWFHQSKGTIVEPHDWLSWSKGGQNWNTMCSSCHSTHLKKNYNETNDSFNTTYEEINVACESCHGPGRKHVDALAKNSNSDPYKRLNLIDQKTQINRCGVCHARRTMLVDLNDPSSEFLQTTIPQNLTSSFYEADGQINEEDFVFGSFLSSKMYRNHIMCSNCHNSHSGEVRVQGNALCLQCHVPEYDTKSHHNHKIDGEGAKCISCHMDGKIYMGNDYRKDHSFRIPRPDQSMEFGTSNSCTNCHKDKDDQWAAKAVKEWYGEERVYHFSDDLLPASLMNAGSMEHLENLMHHDSVPIIIKSTALEYLKYMEDPKAFDLILESLRNKEALIRQSGFVALLTYPIEYREEAGFKGLEDPIKAVRLMAYRTVSHINSSQLTPEKARIWKNVNSEYLRYLKANADFPVGQAHIGEYYQQRNDFSKSVLAFERALKMDSLLVSPYTNLAILYSAKSDFKMVKSIVLKGLNNFPENAEFYYFMGLNEGALGDLTLQLEYLEKAYQLQAENPKYSYNYVLMLYNSGKKEAAKLELKNALLYNPNNQRLLELKEYFNRG
jgi:tetratricopeptide (TPR) repeat protein